MMRKSFVCGNPVYAIIYDGHTHIERRVFEDENGNAYVRINGSWFTIEECKTWFDVTILF